MTRLVALFVSGVALTACASPTAPTDPTTDVSARRVSLARKALDGATRAPSQAVNTRIAFN